MEAWSTYKQELVANPSHIIQQEENGRYTSQNVRSEIEDGSHDVLRATSDGF